MNASKYIADLAAMPDKIGARLDRMGGQLHCTTCKRSTPMKGAAEFLRKGWPKCCGLTMEWIGSKPPTRKGPS